jgi:uncharacterized YigZ family protein
MDEITDQYRSVAAEGEGLYKEKGSRFISMAFPVETEDQIKAIQDSLRKKYHDARHHCFAWRLGLGGARYRASDDGEPSGSSGRPILGQIDSRELSDVLVVVVRYFGGIKLGIPGLIRSYRTAAAEALDNAGTVVKTATVPYRVDFGYMAMNSVMKVFKDMDLPQRGQDFGERCSLQTSVRLSEEASFTDRMSHIEDCAATRL